jgi:hypothetical protein
MFPMDREPCAFCGEFDCAPDDQGPVTVVPLRARDNPDATVTVPCNVWQDYIHEGVRQRTTRLLLYTPGMMITPEEADRIGLHGSTADMVLPPPLYDESRFWDPQA